MPSLQLPAAVPNHKADHQRGQGQYGQVGHTPNAGAGRRVSSGLQALRGDGDGAGVAEGCGQGVHIHGQVADGIPELAANAVVDQGVGTEDGQAGHNVLALPFAVCGVTLFPPL